ncbi:hypothetical protein SAMN05421810_103172 [Amycolatopsis arida]|uniref:Uncharacterized protein n=1 Tax=Amycolatopsis arida TaxID=587909 RepID=A0A1I5SKK3_9PSEU|nr:hypothetical protein [Amycolatopsis arida]TDX96448.1 hypothetical protein CLV69_103586 [Amycolatopsis arida]SFP71249.1 hypothetical protein SAMN05421810_103172 [Amycolatopsis arida]
MSGSLEVRQFLLRYEAEGPGGYAGGVPAQRSGAADASRISDDQVRRARLAVARGATGVEDCSTLLDMLGLVPDEDGDCPVQR